MKTAPLFDQLRSQLIDGQIKGGADRNRAIEITDLAIHAANSALDSMARVCDSSPYGLAVTALAVQLIYTQMEISVANVRRIVEKNPGVRSAEIDIHYRGARPS